MHGKSAAVNRFGPSCCLTGLDEYPLRSCAMTVPINEQTRGRRATRHNAKKILRNVSEEKPCWIGCSKGKSVESDLERLKAPLGWENEARLGKLERVEQSGFCPSAPDCCDCLPRRLLSILLRIRVPLSLHVRCTLCTAPSATGSLELAANPAMYEKPGILVCSLSTMSGGCTLVTEYSGNLVAFSRPTVLSLVQGVQILGRPHIDMFPEGIMDRLPVCR